MLTMRTEMKHTQKMTFLLAIDDPDFLDSRGTGRLARAIATLLEKSITDRRSWYFMRYLHRYPGVPISPVQSLSGSLP
jgi:hypothetical protein